MLSYLLKVWWKLTWLILKHLKAYLKHVMQTGSLGYYFIVLLACVIFFYQGCFVFNICHSCLCPWGKTVLYSKQYNYLAFTWWATVQVQVAHEEKFTKILRKRKSKRDMNIWTKHLKCSCPFRTGCWFRFPVHLSGWESLSPPVTTGCALEQVKLLKWNCMAMFGWSQWLQSCSQVCMCT